CREPSRRGRDAAGQLGRRTKIRLPLRFMVRTSTNQHSPSMMLGARVAIRTGVAALVLMAGLGVVLGAPDPASAAEPSVSVSPASGLDPAGDFVVVTGRGFDPESQLFVMQCR